MVGMRLDFPFPNLQLRATTPYIPPHRTQLHPRMHSSSSHPNSNNRRNNKFLILLASLLTIPSLYYLFVIAQKVHQSSKFAEPTAQFHGIVIDSGTPAAARVRIFKFLGEGQVPFVESMYASGDLSRSIRALIEFAKKRVPKKERANAKVQLLVNGELREGVLEECRRVLRASGFAFKDAWARIIEGKEKGMYSWIAANYVLGTLGGEPQATIGVVELGGASMQVIFAMRESTLDQSSKVIRFSGVNYNLYIQIFPEFGQDAAWQSVHELHNSTASESFSSSSRGINDNPCIPKGYELTSDAAGNFSACRYAALALLKRRQDKCSSPPCQILSSFFEELHDKPVSPENFFYTSELFGLAPKASLSELKAFGQHYCENDWDKLKNQHHGTDDLDLLRYCFFSSYTVALLHDSLGIPMHDKRIGLANRTKSIPHDWTLGAFIFHSMQERPELEIENLDQIVGNESITYFSLFAFLLIALIAAILFLQCRKPRLKTIYDLEKGHYIVTQVPR